MTCNLRKTREKAGIQGAIGFSLASNWLQLGRDFRANHKA